MPMQQVEFEFPDPDKKAAVEIEVEVPVDEYTIEVEGAVGRELVKPKKKKNEDDDIEIEVVDDTPVGDRGKKPSTPPDEVTDDELQSYSDKVKKRIQHFSKGFHDERRAKEQALREREALEQYAKQLLDENRDLKGSVDKGHNALIESAKKQVQGELLAAKQKYRDAYESGNTDSIMEAQELLNSAYFRMDKVAGLKPRTPVATESLQIPDKPVQQRQTAPVSQVERDEKAEAWRNDNPWFGSDDEMTALALGYHNKLIKDGVNPRSEEYYEKVNARMRKLFPENFDEDDGDSPVQPAAKRTTNVVAPATRSTAPKKVRLTESEVAMAKKLGVPLAEYAKQAAKLQRKV